MIETGVAQSPSNSLSAPLGRRDSNLMRSVNNNLRQRSETLPPNEPIAFFCECGSQTCYVPVWKSAADFDATTIEQPGWLLHEGHEPSELWHRREPLPTRTSRRIGTAAGDHQIEREHLISSKDDAARPRHPRLTVLGVLMPARDTNRGDLHATHS